MIDLVKSVDEADHCLGERINVNLLWRVAEADYELIIFEFTDVDHGHGLSLWCTKKNRGRL